jgi:hypothetical protein
MGLCKAKAHTTHTPETEGVDVGKKGRRKRHFLQIKIQKADRINDAVWLGDSPKTLKDFQRVARLPNDRWVSLPQLHRLARVQRLW